MKRKSELIPLNEASKIYARSNGWHYHLSKVCPMLTDGDFERLGYVEISADEVKKRKLRPCVCCYTSFKSNCPNA